MRKEYYLLLFALFPSYTFGQFSISKADSGVFIDVETWERPYPAIKGKKIYSSYRLGPSGIKTLKESLIKAQEWFSLNEKHKKDFKKEINRIKIIERSIYEDIGYNEAFAQNCTIVFTGYFNGNGICELKTGYMQKTLVTLSNKHDTQALLNLLDGKSNNPEIDNIFKN